MSDICCARCGEPWDVDTLHEALAEQRPELAGPTPGRYGSPEYVAASNRYAAAFAELRASFRSRGCIALGWQSTPCPDRRAEPAQRVVAILDELAGDDIDGFASDLDDARRLGLLD